MVEKHAGAFLSEFIEMVSFTDTSKLFRSVNNMHYYQQRFNAFDSDGHLTTRQYLETAGFDHRKEGHLELIEIMGLADLLDKERIKLSSGQMRKMLLCKALLSDPKILILDNPYIGLDAGIRARFNELLDHLAKEKGITIILSGQYKTLPKCIAHRIHLDNGRLVEVGKIEKIDREHIDFQIDAHIDKLLCEIKNHFQNAVDHHSAEHVFSLKGVTVRYGETVILDKLNWTVTKGEKWVLKGNNGSGKSTIVSLLYADNPQAYSQKVFLFGKRRGKSGESIWDIKNRIGFTSPELHAYFYKDMKAMDLVLSGLYDRFEFLGKPSEEKKELARLLFRYFEIEDSMAISFRSLSTGIQRLVFFMRALIKCPEFLLLDEPFQGFDQGLISKSKRLLSEVLTEEHTLIFITHFEDEVPGVVEKVLELDRKIEKKLK